MAGKKYLGRKGSDTGRIAVYEELAAGAGDMVLASIQTVTGAKTFNDGKLILAGATSGTTIVKTKAIAGSTTVELGASGSNQYTMPSAADTLVGRASTDTLTNKVITDSTNTVYDSRVKQSILTGSPYTNATTTGTEITGLQIASTGIGTFTFEFWLLLQSSATGTGWKLGINHTGTATLYSVNMLYPSTGGAAATGVGEDDVANNTGSIYEAAAKTAFATTSPNLGPTAGVAAQNTNILVKVIGIFNATVSGDLEIWCAAETTGTITVSINSVGKLEKYS
jgi:hypothetical protein